MISREICCRVLYKALSTGGDYAEIFAENTVNQSIHMISDAVEAISFPSEYGSKFISRFER